MHRANSQKAPLLPRANTSPMGQSPTGVAGLVVRAVPAGATSPGQATAQVGRLQVHSPCFGRRVVQASPRAASPNVVVNVQAMPRQHIRVASPLRDVPTSPAGPSPVPPTRPAWMQTPATPKIPAGILYGPSARSCTPPPPMADAVSPQKAESTSAGSTEAGSSSGSPSSQGDASPCARGAPPPTPAPPSPGVVPVTNLCRIAAPSPSPAKTQGRTMPPPMPGLPNLLSQQQRAAAAQAGTQVTAPGSRKASPSPSPAPAGSKVVRVREMSPWSDGLRKVLKLMPWTASKRSSSIKEILADEQDLKQRCNQTFKKLDADARGVLDVGTLVDGLRAFHAEIGLPSPPSPRTVRGCPRLTGAVEVDEEGFQQVSRHLLLLRLNEEKRMPVKREMFLGIRQGVPADHYEVQQTLGKGSFGVVKKITCKETLCVRVLKTVDKVVAKRNGLSPAKVMEEIDKLRALDHPAVLRLFEYFADDQALHLVTDHLPGGELSQVVEESHVQHAPLSEPWVRTVFRQMCEGIAYCHGKGVMHRDLKLENIMLYSFEPPQAVIIDMGLAELFPAHEGEGARTSAPTGSIPTMAPEVFSRSSGCKCDVWSLGCCLFGLFCKEISWIPFGRSQLAYPYPFAPPMDRSREQIQEYMRRQRAGPDLTNTRCGMGSGARQLITLMLQCSEEARPTMRQVLSNRWLKASLEEAAALTAAELDALARFPRCSAIEEVVLLTVASQLPLCELGDFRACFRSLDVDGDGRLDSSEVESGLQRAGLPAFEAREVAMKLTFLGPVEFSRFVAALLPAHEALVFTHLRGAFNRLDQDGDGFLRSEELQDLVAGAFPTASLTQAAGAMLDGLEDDLRRVSFERLERYMVEICA